MKKQKFFVRFLCILLAVLMVMSLFVAIIPVRAVSEADISAIRAQRAELQEQLTRQAELIEQLTDNQALIIDRKAALDKQIELNRENIELLEAEIAFYNELIEQKELELNEARSAEDSQTELFRSRVRAMEESGGYSYVTFLFNSNSISELLSRIGDVNDIMDYDRRLEENLRDSRAEVETLKREYEQVELEQSEIAGELTTRKNELNAQIEAACDLIAQLDLNMDNASAEYAAIQKAEAEAYAAEQKALAEYAAQIYAAQMAARAQQGTAASGTDSATESLNFSGGLIWPTDSTYVSSNFGLRDAPTAGASTNHQAIDISAAAGTPIYAAADGYVTVAASNSGLGNYVSIAHDSSTSTRYAHMTNYTVSAGQYVTQGQIIGYVGATGIATGNHLDYAVSVNGQYVDPMSYYR